MRIPDLKLLGDTISSALSAAFYAGMKAEAKVPGSSIVYDSTDALNGLLLALDQTGFDIGAKTEPRPGIVRTTVENGHTTVKLQMPRGTPSAIRHELYLNAVSLLRGPAVPLAEVVAMALGDASPDGCEGNVWKLFNQRLKARGYTIVSDEVDGAPELGTVALLTPKGERVVKAVAKGDFTTISDRDFRLFSHLVDNVWERDKLTARIRELDKLVVGYAERPLTPEDFTGPITLEKGTEATLPPGTQIHIGHTRGLDAPATSPWVLREVIPGTIDIRPNTKVADHEVVATATAVLTKADLSDRRELTVRTAWFCSENAKEAATTEALSLALRQARDAAAAFIAATSPAPATDAEEAA